ncbi:MAG: thiamine diphosphokinase [Clostridia bacterium]|nr:thiamine diphosphokinase [Clostridia bacterium]
MKNALIITGGYLNFERINVSADEYDIVIAADSGYLSAAKLHIAPDIIVGDFDSAVRPNTNAEIITVPAEKDDTDTMLACSIAIKRGAAELLILGGTGGRADHFLSNLFLLETFREQNIFATLTDGENILRVLQNETVTIENRGGYFSLFALDECTVTLTDCKYPLNEFTLPHSNPSFAVSNEVVGEKATVTVKGKAILCESVK